ncbi:MAG TPA: homoserine O-acetyltransferase [Patescibacteria group bacterium]|nr:homoserine O-acetyltransferase [Patescibacteria group bacterium]
MTAKQEERETNVTFFSGYKWRPHLKLTKIVTPDQPFSLIRGGELPEIIVAYETYGKLSAQKDNVILVTHALTGDSHPAAHDQYDEKGWWEPLIGPGRPIDTDRFFVICPNVLGGCQGTTGPASPDPETGKAYGMSFPEVTIRDMVRVQRLLLERLDIHHLALVIGGSMGGMQAMEWAVTFPGFADGVVNIAAPGYATPQAIAYNTVGRQMVMMDPAWNRGDYYGGDGPRQGLATARALAMITYQSDASMMAKFGRRERNDRFEVENYLEYQGESLVKRFDANTYLCLLRALDLHDLGTGYASYETALARIEARVLTVGVSSDILYPPTQQQELVQRMKQMRVRGSYAEIDSPYGHDGFLIDFHLLRPLLTRFVNQIAPAPREPWRRNLFRPQNMAYFGARLVSGIDGSYC